VPRTIVHGLIDIDVAASYLEIETAERVRANPSLELKRRALGTEVGQWYQVTIVTLLALGQPQAFHHHNSHLIQQENTLATCQANSPGRSPAIT